ncbi:MAG: substrate-binding domain-containing protein [Anaerolineales bacterium]|nr:substrate-binding domain-containing protein [Anaerolineales bacterium]
MNRTRWIFFAIIGTALALVIAGIVVFLPSITGSETSLVDEEIDTSQPIEVTIVTANSIESWISEAARQFNQEALVLEDTGQTIHVTIFPMDGLVAKNKFERDEMDPIPVAWIPDSRYLTELVNATFKERLGRDVFLTDGEYRGRPIAITLLAWGIYDSRAQALESVYGEINWQVIHDAAINPEGWSAMGGEDDWGYFKLAISSPRKNISGLAAMVAAAGGYYEKTSISVEDINMNDFQDWLAEIMGSMSDLSGGTYTVQDLALFGYTTGDAGQLLESDLLINMEGIQTRWADPLRIVYPQYVTWFDFPFTIWIGPETTADQKNAALVFEEYLLSTPIQEQALKYGLRPVSASVPVDSPDSLFTKWQSQGAQLVVPRTTAMRSPDRDVLQDLLRFFDLRVADR